MKHFISAFIIIAVLTAITSICLAQSEMAIVSDKEEIEQEDNIVVTIKISNTNIAALTLEIYWNTAKLEYLSGPENSNYSNNRVLYTWISDNGRNVDTLEIGDFVFYGIQNGMAEIVVTGEFYNSNGEEVKIDNSILTIQIRKEMETYDNVQEANIVSANDASLSVLRINEEGISPDFQKNIKEYYFIADSSIDSLEVTAIPENQNATVIVAGNKNLVMGKNTININILSEDKSNEDVYTIYVTRTTDVQKANANLENLAVRQGDLIPEFDNNVTRYQVEIAYEAESIDLLAVPESQQATVTITGSNKMEIGDNTILINVLAEDGITIKKYELIAHRRSEEEELQHDIEEEKQLERLAEILEEQKDKEQEENQERSEQIVLKIIACVIVLVCIAIVGIIIYKKKKL